LVRIIEMGSGLQYDDHRIPYPVYYGQFLFLVS